MSTYKENLTPISAYQDGVIPPTEFFTMACFDASFKFGKETTLCTALFKVYPKFMAEEDAARHKSFKTLNAWRKLGYVVKKGSKGFPFPAKTILVSDVGFDRTEEGIETLNPHIPHFYMFSNTQIIKTSNK